MGWSVAGSASAEDAPWESETHAPTIIVIAGDDYGPLVTELLQATVRARMEQAEVRFVPATKERAATFPQEYLVFRLDTRDARAWVLKLEHQGRSLERKVQGPVRDAAAEEATALIVAQASVALLSPTDRSAELSEWQEEIKPDEQRPEEELPVTDSSSREKIKTTDREEEREATHSIFLVPRVSYRLEPYAQGLLTHGAHVGLEGMHVVGAFFGAGFTLGPSLTVASAYGEFDLARLPIDMHAGWCFRRGTWGLCPSLGIVLEPSWRKQAQGLDAVGVGRDARQFSWGGVGGVTGEQWFSKRVGIFLGVSLAAYVVSPEFIAEGVSDPVLSPYQIRPRLDLGMHFRVF